MWEGKIDKITFCGAKKLNIWLHYYGCSYMAMCENLHPAYVWTSDWIPQFIYPMLQIQS